MKREVDFNNNELRQLKKNHQNTSQMNTMLEKELEKTKEELNSTKKKYYKIRRRNPKSMVFFRFT